MRLPCLLSAAVLALGLAACGDDEESTSTTTPVAESETTTTPETTTTDTTTTTETTDTTTTTESGGGSGGEEEGITLDVAADEAGRQAMLLANAVEGADLFFAFGDDVECTAPGADSSNALAEAPEWTCSIDLERNGAHCVGDIVIFYEPGATSEDAGNRDNTITCEAA